MAVNPVITSQAVQNPNFKGERKTKLVSVSQGDGYEARVYETEALTGKKWGVGIASYFIPGLGQAINGQWGKAAGFFGGSVLSGGYVGLGIIAKERVPIAMGGLAALGITIWSIVDAVKNAKSETTQIIPKNNTQNVNMVA